MANISDFKRGQISAARMAGANVTKTAKLFGIAKCTILNVMTSFGTEGKHSSLKQNSRRKRKLSYLDKSVSYADCKEGSQEYSPENYSRD